jgi:hypothetical protein
MFRVVTDFMRFRYLKDPLFLVCMFLYFVNRWFLKLHFSNEFLHDYLNDVICIPFWVPIMLFIMRKMHLRTGDGPPRGSEILIPLIVWSCVFEVCLPVVPYFNRLATSDYRDIISYTGGALLAALVWKAWYRPIFVEQ